MHTFYCATLLHSRSWLNCACRMVYGIYTETSVIGGISANREPSKVLSANLDGKVFGYNACPTRFSVLGLLNFERHLRPVVSGAGKHMFGDSPANADSAPTPGVDYGVWSVWSAPFW